MVRSVATGARSAFSVGANSRFRPFPELDAIRQTDLSRGGCKRPSFRTPFPNRGFAGPKDGKSWPGVAWWGRSAQRRSRVKFNPAFEKVFVDRLVTALAGATLWSGQHLVPENEADWAALDKAFDQKIFAALKAQISETPVRDFVRAMVGIRLQTQVLVPDGIYPLSQAPGFGDLRSVAEDLFRELSELPSAYAFIFPLPTAFGQAMPANGVWALSDRFQIVKGAGLHNAYDVRSTTDGVIRNYGRDHAAFSITGPHLVVHCSGFVDAGFLNHPFHETMEAARAFLGLCTALGLFIHNPFHLGPPLPPWVMIDRMVDDRFVFDRAERLPSSLGTTLNAVFFPQPVPGAPAPSWVQAIGHHLTTLKYVLGDSENVARMTRAAQWYYDSLSGDNELLQFVQAMVALEILVGGSKEENKRVGVGELMRNRIAYLIGQSISERRLIMDTFDEIYDVRSNIVHAGHSRLTSEQRAQLWTLRDYVARVIRAEAKLMTPPLAVMEAGWSEAEVPPYAFVKPPEILATLAPPAPKPPGIFT